MKKPTTLGKKKLVIDALEDIKARDIQAIQVTRITSMCDWIIVASAESSRQTKALARHVRDSLKDAGSTIVGTEGEETGEWILVDAGDVVAHVMQPAVREYYNLEELWGEGKFDDVVNSSSPAPVAARKPRAPAKKRPAASEKRTATSEKRSAASAKRTAASGKRSAASEKRTATSKKRSATAKKRVASGEKKPAARRKKRAADERDAA
jgi:ribosome-associated protein